MSVLLDINQHYIPVFETYEEVELEFIIDRKEYKVSMIVTHIEEG